MTSYGRLALVDGTLSADPDNINTKVYALEDRGNLGWIEYKGENGKDELIRCPKLITFEAIS